MTPNSKTYLSPKNESGLNASKMPIKDSSNFKVKSPRAQIYSPSTRIKI
jgi:hypothetical protein